MFFQFANTVLIKERKKYVVVWWNHSSVVQTKEIIAIQLREQLLMNQLKDVTAFRPQEPASTKLYNVMYFSQMMKLL